MNAINKGGRPPAIATLEDNKVKILEDVFKIGGTIEEACTTAGISEPTYFATCERLEGFLSRMNAARHYADIAAKNVVVTSIVKDKDLGTSKWWLEKREFKQMSHNIQQVNIGMPNDAGDIFSKMAEQRGVVVEGEYDERAITEASAE